MRSQNQDKEEREITIFIRVAAPTCHTDATSTELYVECGLHIVSREENDLHPVETG